MGYEDDGEIFFSLDPTCGRCGPDYMRECTACKAEFCVRCFHSDLCPECVEENAEDGIREADFDDVDNLKALLGEDEEVERLINDAEFIPPEDLEDEDLRYVG